MILHHTSLFSDHPRFVFFSAATSGGASEIPSGKEWHKEVKSWTPETARNKIRKQFYAERATLRLKIDPNKVLADLAGNNYKTLEDLEGGPDYATTVPPLPSFKGKTTAEINKNYDENPETMNTLYKILTQYFITQGVTGTKKLEQETLLSLHYLSQQMGVNVDELHAEEVVTIEKGRLTIKDAKGTLRVDRKELRPPGKKAVGDKAVDEPEEEAEEPAAPPKEEVKKEEKKEASKVDKPVPPAKAEPAPPAPAAPSPAAPPAPAPPDILRSIERSGADVTIPTPLDHPKFSVGRNTFNTTGVITNIELTLSGVPMPLAIGEELKKANIDSHHLVDRIKARENAFLVLPKGIPVAFDLGATRLEPNEDGVVQFVISSTENEQDIIKKIKALVPQFDVKVLNSVDLIAKKHGARAGSHWGKNLTTYNYSEINKGIADFSYALDHIDNTRFADVEFILELNHDGPVISSKDRLKFISVDLTQTGIELARRIREGLTALGK